MERRPGGTFSVYRNTTVGEALTRSLGVIA